MRLFLITSEFWCCVADTVLSGAMKVLLLLAFVGLALAQSNPKQCITAKLNAATATLGISTGVNTTGIWKDYTVLNYYLLNQWGQNVGSASTIAKMCNGLEQFYGMMYGNYWCFDLRNFLEGGADPINAYAIDGTMNMYEFNCGAGFNTLLHENLECVQRVISGYQQTLQQCIYSYNQNVFHIPANSCQYLQQLEQCYAAPFSTARCRRAEGADIWWACEASRKFGLNHAVNCDNSCDLRHGPRGMDSYLAEHHKVDEHGVHHFKIPDYVHLVDGKLTKVENLWMHN